MVIVFEQRQIFLFSQFVDIQGRHSEISFIKFLFLVQTHIILNFKFSIVILKHLLNTQILIFRGPHSIYSVKYNYDYNLMIVNFEFLFKDRQIFQKSIQTFLQIFSTLVIDGDAYTNTRFDLKRGFMIKNRHKSIDS